ncbi:MAG: hypothetical protein RMA76_13970 [Deltaproteobacteria bacterium]
MPIDFDRGLRRSLRDHADASTFTAEDLAYLSAVVRDPSVSIRSINAAAYDDPDRAMLATLLLVDHRPQLAARAHVVDNLGDFIDALLSEIHDPRAALREEAFGHDPFAKHVGVVDHDKRGVTLCAHPHVRLFRDEDDDVDTATPRSWSPEALQAASEALGAAPTKRMLIDARAVVDAELDRKQALVEDGRIVLDDPGQLDLPRPIGEMAAADIDAVGAALDRVAQLEAAKPAKKKRRPDHTRDALALFAAHVAEHDATLVDVLAALEPEDVVDGPVHRAAGLGRIATALLIVARAIDAYDEVLSAADLLAAAKHDDWPPQVRDRVEHDLLALMNPAPYPLDEGVYPGLPACDPVRSVAAFPDDAARPVEGYRLRTDGAEATLRLEGIEGRRGFVAFDAMSIDALRTLAVCVGQLAPTDHGGLGYLRARASIERGGVTLPEILDAVLKTLDDKVTAELEARAAVAAKLAPLAALP